MPPFIVLSYIQWIVSNTSDYLRNEEKSSGFYSRKKLVDMNRFYFSAQNIISSGLILAFDSTFSKAILCLAQFEFVTNTITSSPLLSKQDSLQKNVFGMNLNNNGRIYQWKNSLTVVHFFEYCFCLSKPTFIFVNMKKDCAKLRQYRTIIGLSPSLSFKK